MCWRDWLGAMRTSSHGYDLSLVRVNWYIKPLNFYGTGPGLVFSIRLPTL